jgi:hypothetical protein
MLFVRECKDNHSIQIPNLDFDIPPTSLLFSAFFLNSLITSAILQASFPLFFSLALAQFLSSSIYYLVP